MQVIAVSIDTVGLSAEAATCPNLAVCGTACPPTPTGTLQIDRVRLLWGQLQWLLSSM